MLVIRRRPGEVLVIDGNIEIEVLESAGSHVKLGIRAPKHVPVARKELLLVGEQNRAASHPAGSAVEQLLGQLSRSPASKSPAPLR